MDVERIRQLRRADPFKPFNLVLTDGRKLPVDEANALLISPSGRVLVFQTLDSWFEQLPPAAVADIDFNINVSDVARRRMLATARAR